MSRLEPGTFFTVQNILIEEVWPHLNPCHPRFPYPSNPAGSSSESEGPLDGDSL